jgi:hypothetical protein
MSISIFFKYRNPVAQTEYRQVPPIRDFLVHRHQASVDIRLFGEWATSMSPHIFAIVEEGMCKCGGNGCKREAIGNGKRCGKEDGAVGLVSLKVEGGVRIDDLRDVI